MGYVILAIVLVLLLLLIIITFIAFKFFSDAIIAKNKNAIKLFQKFGFDYSKRVVAANVEWLSEQPVKDYYITSKDGLKLHGVFLKADNAFRTVICVHGYRGSYKTDFSAIVRYLNANHSNVFFIEQRGHGESEGNYITFGAKEKQDLADWVEFVNNNIEDKNPVYLYGISAGATTCLLTLESGLDTYISGVIADCGYTSMKTQFNYLAKEWYGIPGFPLVNIVGLFCQFIAKFNMNETSTKKALENNKIPILFIHGEADTFVLPNQTRVNYTRDAGPKEILWVKDANHGESLIVNPEDYHYKLDYFFKTYK